MTNPSTLTTTIRHQRKQHRFGPDAQCQRCGETDLGTLQATSLTLCAQCRLALQGKPGTERHHPAGRANDGFTAALPANPHALLSDAQLDWPPATLRNPDRDFHLTLAAWLRFFVDVFRQLATVAEGWARTLETYSAYLSTHLGPEWWKTMEQGS